MEKQSLATDTDIDTEIGKFLVTLYNCSKTEEQNTREMQCSECHSPLAFFCTSCNQCHLPSPVSCQTAAQPLPIQVQTFAEDGSPETLVVQPHLSSQEPTPVQSDTQLLQGESTWNEVQPAVAQRAVCVSEQDQFRPVLKDLSDHFYRPQQFPLSHARSLELEAEKMSMEQRAEVREGTELDKTKAFLGNDGSTVNYGVAEGKIQTKTVPAYLLNLEDISEPEDAVEQEVDVDPIRPELKDISEAEDATEQEVEVGPTSPELEDVSKPKDIVEQEAEIGPIESSREESGMKILAELQTNKGPVINHANLDVSTKKDSYGVLKDKEMICDNRQKDKPVCQERTDGQFLNAREETAQTEKKGEANFNIDGCQKISSTVNVVKDSSSHVTLPPRKEGSHFCRYCERTYLSKHALKTHLLLNHSQQESVFECNLCYRKFALEKGVARHKKKEHPQGTCLQCKSCDFRCRTDRDMINHRKRTHRKEPKRQCEYCGVYLTRTGLRHHVLMHKNEKRYTCGDCGKTFFQKSGLEYHRKGHHAGIDHPYRCDQCGKGFLCEKSLVDHMHRHTGEKPFPCPECPARLINKTKLNRHLKMHLSDSERPYHCELCGKGFISQPSLTRHIRTHTGEKPFQCPQCPSKFALKTYLNHHLKAYHEGPDKPYRCQECGKGFIRLHSLKLHAVDHTGEKPFQCPHCPSKFARKDYLNKHLETHPVEKNFECDLCKRRFLFVSTLNVHKKTVHRVKKQDQQKSVPRVDTAPVMLINLENAKDVFSKKTFLRPLHREDIAFIQTLGL